jgi:hypothetical protein
MNDMTHIEAADAEIVPTKEAFALTAQEPHIEQEPEQIEQPEVESVQPLAYVDAPINLLRAALSCVSKDETRYYLKGVFLHAVDNRLRMVATDGHRLFVASHEAQAALPDWLNVGAILSADNLGAKLALIGKISPMPVVRIGFGGGNNRMLLTDMAEEMTFRCEVVDGTFPAYQQVIAGIGSGDNLDAPASDYKAVTFNGSYLKAVGDVASIATGKKDAPVSVFASEPAKPTLMTFPDAPGAMLVLMPMRRDEVMPAATIGIMAPAIKGTLSALRAHQTRNQEAADTATNKAEKAAYQAKADDFSRRIAELIAKSNEHPALAAPETKPEANAEGEAPEAEQETTQEAQPEATTTPHSDEAAQATATNEGMPEAPTEARTDANEATEETVEHPTEDPANIQAEVETQAPAHINSRERRQNRRKAA